MKSISNITFTEDALIIEYYIESDHPVFKTESLVIPVSFAQEHPQLRDDIKELLDDAQVLLDSVDAAYHKTGSRLKEMGRE